jgi:ATP-dependent DNA helicase RecQ
VASIGSSPLALATGRALAEIGRMRWLGEVAKAAATPDSSRTNSAQRVRALHAAFAAPACAGLTVLLVDDRTDTGWTFALAGRALRQAGADAVLPFALALDA